MHEMCTVHISICRMLLLCASCTKHPAIEYGLIDAVCMHKEGQHALGSTGQLLQTS